MKILSIAAIIISMMSCTPETRTHAALVYKEKTENRWFLLIPGDTLIFGTDTFLVRESEFEYTPYRDWGQSQKIIFPMK